MLRRLLLSFCLVALAHNAHAFPALVVAVHDGDTITAETPGGTMTCRLAGIDSPEIQWNGRWDTQPYAEDARATLSNMVLGETVEVEETGQRSYERVVCRLRLGTLDVQEQMIRAGAAWNAVQFEPTDERDPLLASLQADAQAHHRGLWALTNPIPPWRWRNPQAQ